MRWPHLIEREQGCSFPGKNFIHKHLSILVAVQMKSETLIFICVDELGIDRYEQTASPYPYFGGYRQPSNLPNGLKRTAKKILPCLTFLVVHFEIVKLKEPSIFKSNEIKSSIQWEGVYSIVNAMIMPLVLGRRY